MASFEFSPDDVNWGVCPYTGASVAQTLTKWPDSESMRIFTSTGAAHPTLPNIPLISWSNKPGTTAAGLTAEKDTYTVPSFTFQSNIEEIIWTPWHEIDAKVATGGVVLADYHDLIDNILGQGLPAGVTLGVITTAWGLVPTGGNRPWTQYAHAGVEVFGLDFDGIDPGPSDYIDSYYLAALDEANEIRNAGYRVCVPEFGVPKATWDTTGSARATWFEEWAERFRDFGMESVQLFDNDNDSYMVNDTPSINAWTGIMQTPSATNTVTFA